MSIVSKELLEEAKSIHQESIIIDGHCDTILHMFPRAGVPGGSKPRSILTRSDVGHIDIPRLMEANVTCQFFALYTEPMYKPLKATARALEMMAKFYEEVDRSEGKIIVVNNSKDIINAKADGKIAALISMEGAEPIQHNPITLRMFHKLGLRAISLTWNERNMLADGVGETRTQSKITELGLNAMEEIRRLKILLDVSHLSDSCFWDLIENFKPPIIASHSNARSICNHRRNLTDEQLKILAERGGVAGINFATSFIVSEGTATIDDVIKHIDHIINVAGIKHVGLGSDYDGISSTPIGLEDVSKLPNLTAKLLEHGYSKEDVKKILGENFLRVIREVIG
ncbi:MAG: dipeptidase [Candidatus Methanomethylicia archaeon]